MKSPTVASRWSERSTPKSRRERQPLSTSAVSRSVLLGMRAGVDARAAEFARLLHERRPLAEEAGGRRGAGARGAAAEDDEIEMCQA